MARFREYVCEDSLLVTQVTSNSHIRSVNRAKLNHNIFSLIVMTNQENGCLDMLFADAMHGELVNRT
jgi:hypothetical protein